jgi:hypothetical protein
VYYLYNSKDKSKIRKCDYTLKSMEEFYNLSKVLTHKLTGPYVLCIKETDYKEIEMFIKSSDNYKHLIIYIEVTPEALEYLQARNPDAQLLDSENLYETWTGLIQRYNLILAKGCSKALFYSIKHEYEIMSDIVLELKQTYGNKEIDMNMVKKVISIDDLVYPRSVLISYIRMDRSRHKKLKLCMNNFNKGIIYNSMRKNCIELVKQKNAYYKTGKGSDLIKTLPYENLLKLYYAFITNPRNIIEPEILLSLYERGEYLNDYLQKTTI